MTNPRHEQDANGIWYDTTTMQPLPADHDLFGRIPNGAEEQARQARFLEASQPRREARQAGPDYLFEVASGPQPSRRAPRKQGETVDAREADLLARTLLEAIPGSEQGSHPITARNPRPDGPIPETHIELALQLHRSDDKRACMANLLATNHPIHEHYQLTLIVHAPYHLLATLAWAQPTLLIPEPPGAETLLDDRPLGDPNLTHIARMAQSYAHQAHEALISNGADPDTASAFIHPTVMRHAVTTASAPRYLATISQLFDRDSRDLLSLAQALLLHCSANYPLTTLAWHEARDANRAPKRPPEQTMNDLLFSRPPQRGHGPLSFNRTPFEEAP